MTDFITINDSQYIPVDTIRFIRPIDDVERASIAERYGRNGSKFNIALQFADKSTKLAVDTLDAIRSQGVGLVDIGGDRHVIAAAIKSATALNVADAAKLADRGYKLDRAFRSRIETMAGPVLSTEAADEILKRRAAALRHV